VKRTAAALLVALFCLGCGNSDSSSSSEADGTADSTARPLPTTPQGDVELCSLTTDALPGSAEEPATNDALAQSLDERANSMAQVAGASSGDLANALTISSEAMRKLAEAVAADADPGALNELIAELQADTKFTAAQSVIDGAVAEQCKAGDE